MEQTLQKVAIFLSQIHSRIKKSLHMLADSFTEDHPFLMILF